jgi:hypothetical protein
VKKEPKPVLLDLVSISLSASSRWSDARESRELRREDWQPVHVPQLMARRQAHEVRQSFVWMDTDRTDAGELAAWKNRVTMSLHSVA